MDNFDRALAFVLTQEGGFADHPDDPGGATFCGITQRAYDAWRVRRGLLPQDVRQSTRLERDAIYHDDYWISGMCDRLPGELAVAHFDGCVNAGVRASTRMLQRAVEVKIDGILGPVTLQAVWLRDQAELVGEYLTEREAHYRRLAQQGNKRVFLRGWLKRLAALRAYLKLEPSIP